MASEAEIQAGIQTVLRELDYFEDTDVVINDWTVMDQSLDRAPYAIIFTSGDFSSRQDSYTAQDNYTLPVMLIVALGARSWEVSYNEFQSVRQTVLNKFNANGSTARSANGIDGLNIMRIFSLTEISYVFPQGVDPDIMPDATPDFITQVLGFEVEQF